MESALTPREIQTRIRAGVSLDDVAKAAGVPTEKVEPYAAPVVAEREHVARTALTCPVRRRGESSSTRSLRAVVAERLQHRGIDVDSAVWDAWRDPDRRWTVKGHYHSGSAEHEALFTGSDPVFKPGQIFGHLVIASALGMLGGVIASRIAAKRNA